MPSSASLRCFGALSWKPLMCRADLTGPGMPGAGRKRAREKDAQTNPPWKPPHSPCRAAAM
eukprot:15477116-Alexandrium_andersonii.AAC.1